MCRRERGEWTYAEKMGRSKRMEDGEIMEEGGKVDRGYGREGKIWEMGVDGRGVEGRGVEGRGVEGRGGRGQMGRGGRGGRW